ncbi:MAG: ATP-grasp domain-containing protein [Alphaproteobacteria bacterium]|nr:ATP-grasp domain-containing protein [Alphaproteobacteria bacterium]
MAEKKTLLIVCGGIEAVHGIARAKEMDLHVVVSDRDPDAPGFAIADDRLIVSTYDAEATARAAGDYARTVRPIDGVVCIGADVPVTVATIAARLGLPGISLEAARLATDKLAMKQRFAERGVPIPWFASVESLSCLERHVAERGRDLVIKPVDSRGGRGVQRLNTNIDLALAFERAKAESPTARVMIEAYLSGPQVSTESLMLNGICHTPGFSDRNYEMLERCAPWFIENGGDLPSRLPEDVQSLVCDTVQAAGRALGIANGNIKGDIVVHEGRPYVIELAARLSGGYFCTREIPLNTGVDFVGCVIRMALGEAVSPCDLEPRFQRAVVQRYVFPEPGRILAIEGVDRAASVPGVDEIVVSARTGDVVPPATSSHARAAMVLASGTTYDAALAAASAAVNAIRITTAASPS